METIFNHISLETIVREGRAQDRRKTIMGQKNYQQRKFHEELRELAHEIKEYLDHGKNARALIEELGDVVFCVLLDEASSDALNERLEFDHERLRRYKILDTVKRRYAGDEDVLKRLNLLKLTPTGWVNRDGSRVDPLVKHLFEKLDDLN